MSLSLLPSIETLPRCEAIIIEALLAYFTHNKSLSHYIRAYMGIFGDIETVVSIFFYPKEIILDSSTECIKSLTSCHASRDDDVDQLYS